MVVLVQERKFTTKPSRFLRGVAGSEEGAISSIDKMGRRRDPAGELLRQMSGVSKLEFDPKRGLEYGAYRLDSYKQMQKESLTESLTITTLGQIHFVMLSKLRTTTSLE